MQNARGLVSSLIYRFILGGSLTPMFDELDYFVTYGGTKNILGKYN
jgi:hypothetical protein